jgi:hypothetical protein
VPGRASNEQPHHQQQREQQVRGGQQDEPGLGVMPRVCTWSAQHQAAGGRSREQDRQLAKCIHGPVAQHHRGDDIGGTDLSGRGLVDAFPDQHRRGTKIEFRGNDKQQEGQPGNKQQ